MNRTSPRPVTLVRAASALATLLPAVALAQIPGQWSPSAAPAQTAAPAPSTPAVQAPTPTPAPSSTTASPSDATSASSASSVAQSPATPHATTPAAAPSGASAATAEAHSAGGEVAPYYPQLPQERPAQAGRGFVLSAALGIQPTASVVVSGQTSSLASTTGFAGQVSIGYKAGRAMITLCLGISSLFDKRTLESDTSTSFLVIPGLQVALVRSRDQRAELIGQLRFGAGATIASGQSVPSNAKPDTLLFYEIAPGARYWMHTQFALQFTAGYAGQWLLMSSGTSSETVGAHGLSASLGAVGIF